MFIQKNKIKDSEDDSPEFERKYRLLMNTPVYVDSPLAISATEVFKENMDLFDEETQELIKRGVAPSQLKSKGVGEAEATVPETASDAERLQDRKVEVKALN